MQPGFSRVEHENEGTIKIGGKTGGSREGRKGKESACDWAFSNKNSKTGAGKRGGEKPRREWSGRRLVLGPPN